MLRGLCFVSLVSAAANVAAQPCDVPTPAGCRASLSDCDVVNVTWEHSGGAEGMLVFRNGALVATLPGGERSYVETAPPGVDLVYRIVATRGPEESAPSDVGYVRGVGLSTPTNLRLDERSCAGTVRVTWTLDGTPPDDVQLLRSLDGVTFHNRAIADFDDEWLEYPEDESHVHLKVRVVTSCGEATSEPMFFDASLPELEPPFAVAASDGLCSDGILVRWNYPSDAVHVPHRFIVERDGIDVGQVFGSAREFFDTSAEANRAYSFAVRAERPICEASTSETDEGSRTESEAPAVPETPTVTSCVDRVHVSWAPRSDAVSYLVHRDGVLLDTTVESTFVDGSPEPGVEHEYAISVDTACGPSAPSDVAIAVVGDVADPLPAPTGLSPTEADCVPTTISTTFAWTPVDGAVGYRFGFGTGCDDPAVETTTESSIVRDVPIGVSAWWVEAVDACDAIGERSECRLVDGLPRPAAVESVRITAHPELPERLVVDWDEVPGVSRYTLDVWEGCGIMDNRSEVFEIDAPPFIMDRRPHVRNRNSNALDGVFSFDCADQGGGNGSQRCVSLTCDPIVPVVPGGISASDDCVNQVELSWVDVGHGTLSTDVYRDGVHISTVRGSERFVDYLVLPGTTYEYHLVSRNNCGGISDDSCPVVGTTVADDGEPFPAPTLLRPVDGDVCPEPGPRPILSWEPVSDADGYVVSLGTDACAPPIEEFVVADDTSLRLPALTRGAYSWSVRAIGPCGSRSAVSECRSIVLPDVPGSTVPIFTPLAGSAGHGTISWPAAKWADAYRLSVWVRFPSGETFVVAGGVTSETSMFVELTPWMHRDLFMAATATNCWDEDGPTSGAIAIEFPTPVQLEQLRAEPGPGVVSVEWRASGVGASGFHVDRAVDGSSAFTRLTRETIPPSETETYVFVDREVMSGQAYTYRLIEALPAGGEVLLGDVRAEAVVVPTVLGLAASPNPFNPRTTFSARLPIGGDVVLDIYDVTGRLVDRLIDGQLSAGVHAIAWDGRTASGARSSSGTYFARLQTARGTVYERVVMLK